VALQISDRGSNVAIQHAKPSEPLSETYKRIASTLDKPDRDALKKLVTSRLYASGRKAAAADKDSHSSTGKKDRRQAGNSRSNWDEASKTLTCLLSREGEAHYWHPTQPRLYTPREAARYVSSTVLDRLNVQHSTTQHSTAQHSTAQHSTAQHSTAQHSTAQHSTAQHSPAEGRLVFMYWWCVCVRRRLQSFGDDFELFTHETKDIQMLHSWYKLVGNAVPPLVSKLWGQQILRAASSEGADDYGIDTGKPWRQLLQ
jgi:site-specific DNA-cytosine methylase